MQDRQPPHADTDEPDRFADTSHPDLGPQPSSRPGLDRLVSQHHPYAQTHWRDGLAEALDRERTLAQAAGMELAAVEERQRDLNRQHGEWAAQTQAHQMAGDALERVLKDLDAQTDERRKTAAPDLDDEPMGRRWRG